MTVKPRQILLATALVSLTAVTNYADGVPPDDPKIIVGHGADADDCGLIFTITVNVKGGGHKPCRNVSGVDWSGINFFVTLPVGELVTPTCPNSSAFMGCSKAIISQSGGTETVEIMFFDGEIGHMKNDSLFFVSLNDNSSDTEGSGHWPVGTVITGDAVVPEPGTLLLFASGLGVFCLRRRLSPLA
jgi:PEP-CTERM motif